MTVLTGRGLRCEYFCRVVPRKGQLSAELDMFLASVRARLSKYASEFRHRRRRICAHATFSCACGSSTRRLVAISVSLLKAIFITGTPCFLCSHQCLTHLIMVFSLALRPFGSLHMEIYPAIRDLVHSLAVLPDKGPLQVVSPTCKWTIRRWRLQSSKRRPSRASTYNSGEDIATTSVDSEVNDAHTMGNLASPLYTQER